MHILVAIGDGVVDIGGVPSDANATTQNIEESQKTVTAPLLAHT